MRHGKKYIEALSKFDKNCLYSPAQAIKLIKELSSAKFDETVEVAFRLGVDPRKADQALRGTLVLPKGTGKSKRVLVFAAGEQAALAKASGADLVGADDLVEKIQKGQLLDFDVAIATPDLMPQVGKLGKILGPRGLMPNPKIGTVTEDVEKAVKEFKSGRVEYRTDRTGNVHLPIGKISFATKDLLENFKAAIDELLKAKPASAKGRYLKSITISSTMGVGVKVDPNLARVSEEDIEAAA